MRLLLALHELPPGLHGGVQTHVLDVAKELLRRGHEVRLVAGTSRRAGDGSVEHGQSEGLPLTTIALSARPPGWRRFLSTLADPALERRFMAVVRDFRPDLVHVHHFMYLSLGLVQRLNGLGRPWVATAHDHWLLCHRLYLLDGEGGACPGPGAGWRCGPCNRGTGAAGWLAAGAFAYRRFCARWVARRLPLLLTPSRYLAEFHQRHGVARVQILPSGVEPPGARREPRGKGLVRFAFAGALRPHKGAHLAVEAFRRLEPGLAELTVFGDLATEPAYGESLRQAAESAGVRLVPPFSRADLDRVLCEQDCFIMPSLAAENAPLLARECLARGVPVLASRVGGLPEAAPEGRGLRTFAAGEIGELVGLMRQLAEAPDALEALAAACEPPPTLSAHVDGLLRIYEELGCRG